MMLKAIIFDFDGTIIDTETAWYVAFREAYKKHGVELTLEMYSQCIGTSLKSFNPYEYLSTHMNLPIDLAAFRAEVQQRHSELMGLELIRPGVLEYLKEAKAAGIKIGLASSSPMEWVEKYLRQLGIYDHFECIRTADFVKNVKPDPELYLQALQELGVEASEALAIEDSPNGAKAAAAAGIRSIVTPNAITKLLPFEPHDHKFETLADFPFREAVSLFQK